MSLNDILYKGTLVSTGAAQTLNFAAGFDQFILRNRNTLAGGAGVVDSEWWTGMANGGARISTLGGGTYVWTQIAAGGFTVVDTATATLGPAIAVTAITAANPPVASTATTPTVGQIVRVYGTTGMLQIAGMDFTVTAVNAGVSMSFGYLVNAAAFAAAATAGTYRVVPVDLKFYPRMRYITAITRGVTTTIQMSVVHGYNLNERVSFRCTPAFGTSEINGLTGTIIGINTATNTITVDINSAAFTAFAFPTSAVAAGGVTFPQVIPVGELGTTLASSIIDTGTRSIQIGATIAGTANDILDYWVYRGES